MNKFNRKLEERLRASFDAGNVPAHVFKAGADGTCVYDGLPELHPSHPEKADAPAEAPAQEVHTGVMVALFPSPQVAMQLAVEGGEPAHELHVTLVFLGKRGDIGDRTEELRNVISDFASTHAPISGEVSGLGLFTAGPQPVTYASVDVPELPEFRQDLVKALENHGFVVSKQHGYTPHMTLTYADSRDLNPPTVSLDFANITVAIGGERFSYPLGAKEMGRTKTVGEQPHKYVHPAATKKEETPALLDEGKFAPPCDECNLALDDAIHQGDTTDELRYDENFGVLDDPKTGATARPFSMPTPHQKPTVAPATASAGGAIKGWYGGGEKAEEFFFEHEWEPVPGHPAEVNTCHVCGLNRWSDEHQQKAANLTFSYTINGLPQTAVTTSNSSGATFTTTPRVAPEPVADATDVQRAFVSEVNGKTFVTAPAGIAMDGWEKAGSPNEHMLWIQGRFVGGEKANRNGAFWSTQDLEVGHPTVTHGPLNWLHEARHIIGTIADSKLVQPTAEQAGVIEPHINALSNVWKWIYPDEAYVIEQASDAGKLWYSMECVSKEVSCVGDAGCGAQVSYMDYIKANGTCNHMVERSATRRFIDPIFLGGAVIVPPVRPGWAEADARVLREAAALAEQSFDAAHPDMTATEWELLMAQLVRYGQR